MAKYRNGPDACDLGGYYIRHIDAMTAEGLHSKSEIARELAWRDMQLAAMERVVGAGYAWKSAETGAELERGLRLLYDALAALDAIKRGEG